MTFMSSPTVCGHNYKIQIQGAITQSQMTFKWPLWPHTVGDDINVINKCPFFTEYF
jgi:hypothetical protein